METVDDAASGVAPTNGLVVGGEDGSAGAAGVDGVEECGYHAIEVPAVGGTSL